MKNATPRPAEGQAAVELYPVSRVMEILDCSDMHVYRQIRAGELRAVDIASPGCKPKLRIRSDDLSEYIERRTRG